MRAVHAPADSSGVAPGVSSALVCVRLASTEAEPWRNGGGRTRELLRWPAAGPWSMRVSVADIDADGLFSAFPGVERWFAVIDGAGVTLGLGGIERPLLPGDPPLCFEGASAPACRLLEGPTRDLNLMLRGGRGVMRRVEPGAGWCEPFVLRALYAAEPGDWSDGGAPQAVEAGTLGWSLAPAAPTAASAWTFEPRRRGPQVSAWWLGFTPEAAPG